MGAKWCFFADPARLAPQAPGEAFGPLTAEAGSDRFQVTDLHTATAGAPAFAVCDGLICAQLASDGSLTLILKPAEQPPFDFPAISYILYKGVSAASLISGSNVDVSLAASNPLVDLIKTTWELPANGNPAGSSPPTASLGLHLTPAFPGDATRFADSQRLDRLFYDGDPTVQLPLVRGGWKLGEFTAAFGLEIVVERIGRQPTIGQARRPSTLVEVPTLASGADASATFRHWAAKDEILDFVDPCAFWGSFLTTRLRVWNGSGFDRLTGEAIYDTVLRGAASDAANFANRNRAYLDIRNEHGNSLNYYQTDGPTLQLTLDPDADIDSHEVNYYASGWPSFTVDNADLPAGVTGGRIDARFALPKSANTRPLIFISAGYRGALRRLKDGKRFLDCQRRPASPYLYETSITLPLVNEAGSARIVASYQRLHVFKRPLIVNGEPVPPANADSFAPNRASALDDLVPLLSLDDLPLAGAAPVLRTFDEVFYVDAGTETGEGFVANPALAADPVNAVLIMVPKMRNTSAAGPRPTPVSIAWPALALPTGSNSIFPYLAGLLPSPLKMTRVDDPQSGDTVELVYVGNTTGVPQAPAQDNPGAVVLALGRPDHAELVALLPTSGALHGMPMLSLAVGTPHNDGLTRYLGFGLTVNFLAGATAVARQSQPAPFEIYRHVDL